MGLKMSRERKKGVEKKKVRGGMGWWKEDGWVGGRWRDVILEGGGMYWWKGRAYFIKHTDLRLG